MSKESTVSDLQPESEERICRICALPGRVLRKLERERFIEGRGWGYLAKAILPPLLPPGYPTISRELLSYHFNNHVPESVILAYQGERGRRDPLPEERDNLVSDVLRDHIEHYAALQNRFLALEGVIGAIQYVLEENVEGLIPPLALLPFIRRLQNEEKRDQEVLLTLLMRVIESQKSVVEQCRKLTPTKDMLTSLIIKVVNQIVEKWSESLSRSMTMLERDLRASIPNGPEADMIKDKVTESVKGIQVTILSQSKEDKDAVLMGLEAMMKTRFETYVSE